MMGCKIEFQVVNKAPLDVWPVGGRIETALPLCPALRLRTIWVTDYAGGGTTSKTDLVILAYMAKGPDVGATVRALGST